MRHLRLPMIGSASLLVLAPLVGADVIRPEWVTGNRYRIIVMVEPGEAVNAPTGVALDFRKLFKEKGLPGRLDRHSIRVVRYDPKTGRPVPHSPGSNTVEVPYQLTGDFANEDAGTVWWRIPDRSATPYHVYFDSTANGPKKPPALMALAGVGDSFHYNDGKPGPANVSPLHSTYWYLD